MSTTESIKEHHSHIESGRIDLHAERPDDLKAIAEEGHVAPFDEHGHALAIRDEAAERRLRWKLDLRLLPIVFILFLLQFIDRTNVGNARLAGLERELGMTGYDFNTALSVFFVPYIIFEIPAMICCKIVGPGRWLPLTLIAFGMITMLTAFIQNYAGLIAIRFFLGISECSMLPGLAYYLSRFYRKEELVFRMAFYFLAGPIAGAFGGLLASAILTSSAVGSVTTWRQIFLWEGLGTMIIGIAVYCVMPDRPGRCRFLTADEKTLAEFRIKSENVGITVAIEQTKFQAIKWGVFNINAWLIGLIFLLNQIITQGISVFFPTLINGLYPTSTVVQKQLKTVPPYALAAGLTLMLSYLSMRVQSRSIVMLIISTIMIAGFGGWIGSKDNSTRYGLSFMVIGTLFAYGPLQQTWMAINMASDTSRAAAIGTINFIGNCGGLISTWTFLPGDAPLYHTGLSILLGAACLNAGVVVLTVLYMVWENKQREAGKRNHRLNGLSSDQVALLGHRHPLFRFRY